MNSQPTHAIVVMVNDFPVRVVAFNPNTTGEGALENALQKKQREIQLAEFKRECPREDPKDHPIHVGHVHTHVFSLEVWGPKSNL